MVTADTRQLLGASTQRAVLGLGAMGVGKEGLTLESVAPTL